MRNGSFSRYYNTDSFIHSMNPLCKVLGLLIFVLMTMLASNIRVICGLFLILLFIIVISDVPLKNYIKPNIILFQHQALLLSCFLYALPACLSDYCFRLFSLIPISDKYMKWLI